ncbi:MAG: PilN domain-containing protein [Bacillota bacterium]
MATPGVNLLPPELRRHPRRARRGGWVIAAAVVLSALTAYDISVWLAATALNRQAAALEARGAGLAADLREVQDLQRRTTELKALQGRYQALRGQAWSQIWADLAAALPAGVELQQITTTERAVQLTCSAGSLPLAAAAEDGLAALPAVSGVSLSSARSDGLGHLVFTLEVALRAAASGAGRADAGSDAAAGGSEATSAPEATTGAEGRATP